MPSSPLNAQTVVRITRQMLRPYPFPPDSPYVSADQQRLSAMNLQGRSAWMAEWLRWAQKPGSEGQAKPAPLQPPGRLGSE